MTASWTAITDRLALGGAFTAGEVPGLAAAGMSAVVDLREEACDDAALLARHGLAFLHLPTPDHAAVSLSDLAAGVAFAREHGSRGRVLVHCQHGIGRSATLGLCILVAEGFAPLDALDHAKTARERVSPSPAQYHAFVAWLDAFRAQTSVSWTIPHFDAFAAIAYRHLRAAERC